MRCGVTRWHRRHWSARDHDDAILRTVVHCPPCMQVPIKTKMLTTDIPNPPLSAAAASGTGPGVIGEAVTCVPPGKFKWIDNLD